MFGIETVGAQWAVCQARSPHGRRAAFTPLQRPIRGRHWNSNGAVICSDAQRQKCRAPAASGT